eukprot:scaffold197588_cov18-Tisochrysis_lutea.AAC.1
MGMSSQAPRHPCALPFVSADSEVRLHKKCRELNAEIVANAAKVQTALKLNEEDQGTIAALKKEIEKAWKMVDARWVLMQELVAGHWSKVHV